MSWEKHGTKFYYYRVQRNPNGRLSKTYCGTGTAGKKAAAEDHHKRTVRKQEHIHRQFIRQLDTHLKDLTMITQTFTKATLLSVGYHQHKRQWRKWRQIIQRDQEGEHAMEECMLTIESHPYDTLETLVHQAQQGDTTTLPTIRALLDQVPELWTDSRVLVQQVERSWITVLSGSDLVSKEIIEREIHGLRSQLLGPHPTTLEKLLVDRICVCCLALQHAELHASRRFNGHTVALTALEENRLDKVHHRFLTAIRELARVRKLLSPAPPLQVNIGTNQVNFA